MKKETKVINLFSGPGCGKSTLAAELYHKLKVRHIKSELVREYVKDWAWEARQVGQFDQIYIAGKQCRRESMLYGKVDVIVTDSPILLSPFYQDLYSNVDIVKPSVLKFLDYAKTTGVKYHNYLIKRETKYDAEGRYETEEEAIQVDQALERWLRDHAIRFTVIEGPNKADFILKDLGIS